jgi:hypothetical protein
MLPAVGITFFAGWPSDVARVFARLLDVEGVMFAGRILASAFATLPASVEGVAAGESIIDFGAGTYPATSTSGSWTTEFVGTFLAAAS